MRPLNIALLALAVTCVLIAVTASAINTIAVAEIKPEAQRYSLTHGSVAKARSASDYSIVYLAVPPGKKAFPAELVTGALR